MKLGLHIASTDWEGGPGRLGARLAAVAEAAEAAGFDTIDVADFGFDVGPDGSKAGELIGQLRWLAGLGIETVFGWVVGVDQITPLEVMGREVIPAVAELRPGG
jgi:hypothetical protein